MAKCKYCNEEKKDSEFYKNRKKCKNCYNGEKQLCDECGKYFKNLKIHKKLHTTWWITFKCKTCLKEIESTDFNFNEKKCKECHNKYKRDNRSKNKYNKINKLMV